MGFLTNGSNDISCPGMRGGRNRSLMEQRGMEKNIG